MSEQEIQEKENELYKREVLLNIRDRDLRILEKRIRKEYEKLFPGVEIKLRDL